MSDDDYDYVSVQRPKMTILLADRAAIIEECAQELEAAFAECSTLNLLHGAARIRALKDKST